MSVLVKTGKMCSHMSCETVLDILDNVQTCPKCLKRVILEKLRKLRSSGSRKFGTRLADRKIGIRADPDSSRHDLGVAIASVALPKRECGRSLEPRYKRGVWEFAQWSRDEAGWSEGFPRVCQVFFLRGSYLRQTRGRWNFGRGKNFIET